ncbi:MAG: hypothetical protein LCI00_17150 [Chloroflexi bacterium]|nr:hypothetical protein [Chloroflexota bacterium]MCC6896642.1 hypothetical protein [Anaerolineae bacterium]
MRQLFSYEKVKPFFYAFILIGLALLVFGLYRFVTTSQAVTDNFAYRYHQQNTAVQSIDEATARVLMSADLDLRDLERQRNEAVIVIGAGIILTAVGWLLNDFFRSRHQKFRAASAS